MLCCGAAEPVLETRRAEARVFARGEALIVQLYAEVARVDVRGDLPCIPVCPQELPDEFVETYRFGTRQLDRAVQRFFDCDVRHYGSDDVRTFKRFSQSLARDGVDARGR